MSRIPIGLQLYSVRHDCARDLPGTLKAVAAMGYEGVEFYTFHGHTARELRQMLDDLGLKCCGTHIGLDALLGDRLPGTIAYALELGIPYLIVPGLPPERTSSLAAWRETAAIFADLAGKLTPHGLKTGYHNHDIEFRRVDGELPFDIFFGNTGSEVIVQVDLGNAIHGGGNPIACLRRYPGRLTTIHLKEFSPDWVAPIGEGAVDWEQVFAICEKSGGTEWYIVEHETEAYPALWGVQRCLENLRKMGK